MTSSSTAMDAVLPHSRTEETALVSACALDDRELDKVSRIIHPADLTDPTLRHVYTVLLTMRREREPVDHLTLANRLKVTEYKVSTAELAEILQACPVTTNATHYAATVKETAKRRRLLTAINNAWTDASDGKAVSDVITDLDAEFYELQREGVGDSEPKSVSIGQLIADYPKLRDPIIDGIARKGEVVNLIAATKVGKSWLTLYLMFCIAMGLTWLKFQCRQGRVLLIDNELHPETLASRIRTVAKAMGIRESDYADHIEIITLRGRWIDLHGLQRIIGRYPPGTFDAILLDAWYRVLPEGTSENDNAQVMRLYNMIDVLAMEHGAMWLNIHHSSKGIQGDKRVTDVGAGAGSQSRAADAHLILREHEEPDVAVFEGSVRSFAKVEPLALRWEFPLWHVDGHVDTKAVKGRLTKQQERQLERDREGREKILAALQGQELTVRELRRETGISPDRIERLLDLLEAEDDIERREILKRGNPCQQYRIYDDFGNDWQDVDGSTDHVDRPPDHVGDG